MLWAGGVVGCANDADPVSTSTEPTTAARPVVVDTDLASDDLVALALLLSSSEIEVVGITVSGTGEVRCPTGAEVARRFLAATGDEDVPVACGRTTPLVGDHAFPSEWRDSADDAWGLELPALAPTSDTRTAVELLTDALGPGGVTVLTLGPLTNIADAFRTDPGLVSKVDSIVMMGGAVDVAGNVFGEGPQPPVAEWNAYVDPVATAEVIASGVPIVMVGLDATNQVPITGDFLELLDQNAHTDEAVLVQTLLRENPLVNMAQGYFWDPLAAAAVIDPQLVSTENVTIAVDTSTGPDSGRTTRSSLGSPVKVAVGADLDRFEPFVVRTLGQLGYDAEIVDPLPPVGNVTIRFDGTMCTFEPSAEITEGRLRFTFETTDPAWTAAIAPLDGELTVEELREWIVSHPDGSRVPGIGQPVAFVWPNGIQYTDTSPGTAVVLCASEDGRLLLAGSFEIT